MDFDGRDEYVGIHYLTEMPKSIEKWKVKGFSLKAMEEAIHFKLTQQTARDDMFQDFLKIFRIRAKRQQETDDMSLRVHQDTFFDLLRHIGVFATREQANMLFSKYDEDCQGSFTVKQFFERSRPDYSDNPFTERERLVQRPQRGKKQYLATRLAGVPVMPHDPASNVYNLTVEKISEELAFKLQSSLETGKTVSAPFARRYLARHFEFHDQNHLGYVDEYSLRRALDKLNYPLGPNQRELLCGRFPGPHPGTFNYKAFVMAVYPANGRVIQTSLNNASDSGIAYLKQLEQEQVRTRTPVPPRKPQRPSGSQTYRPHTAGGRPSRTWNSGFNGSTTSRRPRPPSRGGSGQYAPPPQLDWRNSKFPPGHPVYSNPAYQSAW